MSTKKDTYQNALNDSIYPSSWPYEPKKAVKLRGEEAPVNANETEKESQKESESSVDKDE